MNTRFNSRLKAHLAQAEASVYLHNKLKAGAFDRLFDNFNVLDKKAHDLISEKIRFLINDFYQKAIQKLDGFAGLSRLNFIQYNDRLTQLTAYEGFEARLEKFIQKEVLEPGSAIWLRIQALAQDLIRRGCNELLDDNENVCEELITILKVTDLTQLKAIRETQGARKIVKSFAAEAVRQVDQTLRDREENSKARETACGVHAFTAIERGLQHAIARNIRFIGLTNEEAQLVVSEMDEGSSYSHSDSDSPKSIYGLFKPVNMTLQPERNFALDVVQFGKKLFGIK